MSSLLAILLVVNSARGHHYVFSYPPDPKRPLGLRVDSSSAGYTVANSITKASLHSQPLRPTNQADRYNSHGNGSADNSRRASVTTSPSKSQHDKFAGRDRIFNIEVSFLADALAPKLPLCDRKFQLSMDDLTFVGHPVSLTANDKQDTVEEVEDHAGVAPSLSSPHRSPPPSPHDSQSRRRGGHHYHNSARSSETEERNADLVAASTHMTLFHVVYVLSPHDLELNNQVDSLYTHVILKYAASLRYEQLRCGYVQEEIEKMLALKEEAFNNGTPYDEVMEVILRESSLARDIKQIYCAISTNTAAHVIINDFIDLSLQIPVLGPDASTNNNTSFSLSRDVHQGSLMDIYGMGGYEYESYPMLCPYHTLLLLEDPEEVLKNMPLDASPTLVQLVQILTPTQSLQELHLLLDCSLAQIYRLAAHLIYWRKAKLIHTIHQRNIYVVSPQASLNDISVLDADFKMHIPNLDLPTLLSQLSIAKPLHMITPSKELRNQYLEAITYLVRKDLVVQLHMFLVLMLPSPDPEKSTSTEQIPTSTSENTMASSPATSTDEISWYRLKRLAHEKAPKEIAELFERLIPYMDGKHHIDEIMYREAISRKQLKFVLKYYRDIVFSVYHYC
ncbi:nitrogen permease regulator of amino acid transport activity 3-domain-containing protein [Radiomyces spectabilis]|uniref:nitrogen permease regulator of amino acid transport activity 3-domain-containing protein n=1 Tax=Radiomyces spectabilis TaxID=64574 RepID=UPI00221F6DE4|nr:nitrogen permease regulator of amino acid transport activity 3-domain-containing protein [Radiomyces spectabilis]KAI8384271.1 nitrogen permease regulator of amino acid transport activity 3-domain-containing protein [Radiomyces spectabilis]